MSRLLLDEMLSPRLADALRQAGLDVQAVAESEPLRGLPDAQILELAVSQLRILVTMNVKDFAQIDKSWRGSGRSHAGILYLSTKSFPLNASFVGAVKNALVARHDSNSLPTGEQTAFL